MVMLRSKSGALFRADFNQIAQFRDMLIKYRTLLDVGYYLNKAKIYVKIEIINDVLFACVLQISEQRSKFSYEQKYV
jgi:hypothetical protein